MAIGARTRGALILLPVVAELAVLAGLGIVAPHHLTGIDEGPLLGLTLGTTIISTTLLAAAAARCRERLRTSWAAMSAACALWGAALAGELLGWPTAVTWGWLRGAACLAVTLAILRAPGVRRGAREWGLLLLDGWLVGVSVFLIGWVALRLTTSTLSGGPVPAALYWLPLDLALASTVTGLALRASGPRAPLALIVLAALLTVTSDTTWALTEEPGVVTRFGVLEWLIALSALGWATLSRGLDLWSAAPHDPRPERDQPPLTRLAQLAMVPGLLAAAVPGADRITFTAAASLVLGLAVEVALTRRQHDELWRALQDQARRTEQLLQDSRDAIVRVGHDGRISYANPAVAEVFGHPPGALIGVSWFNLLHPDDRPPVTAQLARLDGADHAPSRIAARFRAADGGWRELESTVSISGEGYTLSVRDVSERSRLEADLRRQASTDGLTGLFNRKAFVTLLEERLPRGDTHLLFIDLDGFKAINDTDGHLAGDQLLREVADALRAELRPGDVAARLGGDEFAVLPAVRDLDGTTALAARLVRRIGAVSDRHGGRIGASIGVTDGRHDDPEVLLRRADLAMYQAKAGGGRRYVVLTQQETGADHDTLPLREQPAPTVGPTPGGGPAPTVASPGPSPAPGRGARRGRGRLDVVGLREDQRTKRA